MSRTLLVTGGAGFIGSSVILKALAETDWQVINVDKLTYSGNLQSLKEAESNPRYSFVQADIADASAIGEIFSAKKPDLIMHLAAESHVDRSIDRPDVFIDTNIRGTYVLLEAARRVWKERGEDKSGDFRFLHISTDEVFGDLKDQPDNIRFSEITAYNPSSPYSASKAASDHLVRAWQRTYGLPAMITNCSNNYGPRQFPEKLIPVVILSALQGKSIPVYGMGQQIRDWLYVGDHAAALLEVIKRGQPGSTYAIGGKCEQRNIDVVQTVCRLLDELHPRAEGSYKELITFVNDRPGHDGRYAIDPAKIENELGWRPKETFTDGIRKTVQWYLDNQEWWQNILNGSYRLERQGLNV